MYASVPHPRYRRRKIYYETKFFLLALGAGFPGALIALILLWFSGYSLKVELTLTAFILLGSLGFAWSLRSQLLNTLRTLSNLLGAYCEGDYSLRSKHKPVLDSLGELTQQINSLGDALSEQRRDSLESVFLLRKVMDEIEVAIVAFDERQKLRWFNRYAERLFGKPEDCLKGFSADEVGLAECLIHETPRIVDFTFPGRSGRWELRRGSFRERGIPHQLLVLSDMTRTLREEEHQAWQRLLQVLRHEINNSLAPIHSLTESLLILLNREPRPENWEEDFAQGLQAIANRSHALNRFMASYTKLTRLPKPTKQPVNVTEWIQRVISLETRLSVEIHPGPAIILQADGDQLDQVLINLIRNAVEAVQETGGGVRISWSTIGTVMKHVEILVEDEGIGICNPENLFIPFFTTKPEGTGLGLMLSRQIVEAHGGNIILENRTDMPGCRARIRLPLE